MHIRVPFSSSRVLVLNRLLLLALLPLALLWAWRPAAANTANTIVTNCTDAGLRAAVLPGGTVTFSCPPSTTIVLGSLITTSTAVRIDGANGGHPITLSGGSVNRIISSTASLELDNLTVRDTGDTAIVDLTSNLTIDHVTFTNNHSQNNDAVITVGPTLVIRDSRFISNSVLSNLCDNYGYGRCTTVGGAGATTILRTVFDSNSSLFGPGALELSGIGNTLAITDSIFINNAGLAGGAVGDTQGALDITNSDFISNTAAYDGGAIDTYSATLNVVSSRFANNTAAFAYGGAIAAFVPPGPTTIAGSLFYSNTASNASNGIGGAIFVGGPLTLTNSSLVGNSTAGPHGGGLFVANSGPGDTSNVTASTLIGNSSSTSGGSVFATAGSVSIQQSILYGGTPDDCDGTTTFISAGYNDVGTGCPTNGTTDISVDPQLAPLNNYGGPTVTGIPGYPGYPMLTRLPYTGSPVVGVIPNNQCATNVDQRGFSRPATPGDNCDMGAVEGTVLAPPPPPPPAIVQQENSPSSFLPPADFQLKNLTYKGEPVNTIFGTFGYQHTDLTLAGLGLPVRIQRTYNSYSPTDSLLGFGWNVAYDLRVTQPATNTLTVKRGDGRLDPYALNLDGSITPPAGSQEILTGTVGVSYTLTTRDFIVYQFNSSGRLTSASDPDGNVTTLNYTSGKWTGITDAAGRAWTLTYNGDNRVSSVHDPAGRVVTYGYDVNGNLANVTDAAGGLTTYAYDAAHHLTSITDANGHLLASNVYDAISGRVTQQTDSHGTQHFDYTTGHSLYTDALGFTTNIYYDNQYRVVSQTNPLNGTAFLFYDGQGLIASTVNETGHQALFAHDAHGNRTVITDTLGGVWTMTYDARNNMLTSADPLGHTTGYTYNAGNHPLTRTDALGHVTSFGYNNLGLLTSQTDALGHLTSFGYDSFGNRSVITDAVGAVTHLAYDSAGRTTALTDALGHATGYTYNALNLLLTTTAPDGGVTTNSYDAAGNRRGLVNPLGRTFVYTYTAANDLAQTRDPLGDVNTLGYDALGHVLTETLPNGAQWLTGYDALGRAVQRTSPLGFVTHSTYDALGNLTSATDAASRITTFAYDAGSRLTTVTDALAGVTTYAYDAVGNRTTVTDARGHTTTDAYDALNRLVSETDPLGHAQSWSYDLLGRVTSQTNGAGQTITRSYDALGRLLTLTADAATTGYAYDLVGNRTAMTDTLGVTSYSFTNRNQISAVNGPQGAVTYAYDLDGQRTSLAQPGATVNYNYDAADRMAAVKLGASGVATYSYDSLGNAVGEGFANGVSTTLSYDLDGRLTHLVTNGPGGVLQNIGYTLDAMGNRSAETGLRFSATYAYDALYRLTGASTTLTTTLVGDYRLFLPLVSRHAASLAAPDAGAAGPDQAAGLTMVQSASYAYVYDATGNRTSQTEPGANKTYSYDNGNRISTAPYLYDSADRLTNDGANTYTYDSFGRLTGISGSLSASFKYDGDGNRVRETINGATTNYLLDVAALLPQRIAATTVAGTQRYLYGLVRVAQVTSLGALRYETEDGLGNVRLLTSAGGAVLDRSAYAPFGARLAGAGAFGFTGEPQANLGGLVYLRTRDYNPALGRFLIPDQFPAAAYVPQTLNRYGYVRNNPPNAVDPSGQCSLWDLSDCIAKVGQFINNCLHNSCQDPNANPPRHVRTPSTNLQLTPPGVQPVVAPPAPLAPPVVPPVLVESSITKGGGINGVIASDSASVIASDSASLIGTHGGKVITENGSGLIGNGSSTLIGNGSSTLVASGAGNLVASGGGNLVASGGGNLVASGGGNLVASGGGNLVASGAGN